MPTGTLLTELERALLLPVELPYPLPDLLKDVIRGVFLRGRLQSDTAGLMAVVVNGFDQWKQGIDGLDIGRKPLQHAYVRTIAIAIPELYVVAVEQKAFGDYRLDEAEQRVLADARKDFDAKLALAQAVGGRAATAAEREALRFTLLRQAVVNCLG